ncbi:MAG: DUF4350 domain-containing protein [Myxococcota bacterium]
MRRWWLGLVPVALVAGGWRFVERGPVPAPWADPLPTHAVLTGYARFYAGRGGVAVPAWIDGWFARNPPSPDGPVLVDTFHATKQPWNAAIAMDAYRYDAQHGLARALQPVRDAGIRVEPVEAPWSPARLTGASAVFVNLVSGDNPAITWSEARTLESFVRHGGGLVLITDHSNAYFHAEVLFPLTSLLGVEVPPVTATDEGPGRQLSTGVAWIRAAADGDHPVGEGVRTVGMLTAGTVEAPPGWATIAHTSADGWADRWTPYRKADSNGFTGNLKREKGEAPGPSPLVVAGEHGEGRVVVLADQNAWGATMIGYEDNARLFANAMAWAIGRPVPYEARSPRSVTTVVSEARSDCTAPSDWGFRTLQVLAAKHAARTGVPDFCTATPAPASRGIVLLPQPERPDLATLLDREVLALLDRTYPSTAQLLVHLGLAWDGVDLVGPAEVLERDDAGRPLVARAGRVTMVMDAGLLRNDALGGERDDPADGPPDRTARWKRADRLLGDLFDRVAGG